MSKLKVVLMGFFAVMLIAGSCLPARAADGPRFRYANSLAKTINQDWGVSLYSEFDTDRDRGHDLNGIDQEFTVSYTGLASWLSLGPGVGYWDAKGNGTWENTVYPYGFITFQKTFLGLSFNDRNRFDAEVPEHGEEGLVYRNGLTIATARTWTKLELQPYVSDEIFYSCLLKRLVDNQAFAGVNFKIIKNVNGALFFMMESSNNHQIDGSHWKKTPMVGLSTSVNF